LLGFRPSNGYEPGRRTRRTEAGTWRPESRRFQWFSSYEAANQPSHLVALQVALEVRTLVASNAQRCRRLADGSDHGRRGGVAEPCGRGQDRPPQEKVDDHGGDQHRNGCCFRHVGPPTRMAGRKFPSRVKVRSRCAASASPAWRRRSRSRTPTSAQPLIAEAITMDRTAGGGWQAGCPLAAGANGGLRASRADRSHCS
jgi:hypothetical protein